MKNKNPISYRNQRKLEKKKNGESIPWKKMENLLATKAFTRKIL